ncbi:MAG TPA: PAS domain S-box protein, partial [Verrucomicrobiae bacterium]|nr:PAS domain S-box protein [Verrucomicrobiae bacterium]
MTVSCSCAFAAASGTLSNSVALQKTNNPTPAAFSRRSSIRPDQLPVSRISSLTRDMAVRRTNGFVRVEGVVLDQRLGEYVIVQENSSSIRAETRQTTLLAGGERVTVWGIPAWDGNNVYLRLAGVRPVSWDALAVQRVVPAPGRPEELPTLTQVRQIRDLTPDRAAWKYPVRVRGVITTIWKDNRSLFVQDETAGIFVDGAGLSFGTNWDTGDLVELEGVSGPGEYAPIIEAHSVRNIGPGRLPAARMVTLYQMASGQLDGQWVEVRGVVRSVRVNRRSTDLQLSDVNGLVEVSIPGGDVFTNFLDSLVRVRGVCGSRANPNRQLMGAYVWSPRTNLLVVEERGISDPFTAPVRSIGSLSQFSHWRETQHLIKIVGVVTFSQPDRPLFVQDETGGMPVYLAHSESLQPGDRVEISGYLSPGDFGYAFRNAYCRVVAHDPIPQPKLITAVHILDPNLHGMWVQLSARILSSSHRANEQVLTLQADNSIFEALLPGQSGTAGAIPPLGSLVQLKGVYSVLSDESRQPRALRLYIPINAPILLLEKSPWWNSRRASTAVGILVVVVLAAALWAITLRRRVAQQTLDIRQRLAKEAALEESYRELFEGANDLIYTFDLDGRMTSLNPAGQRVLGYSGSEIEKLTIDRVLSPSSRSRIDQMLQSKSAYGSTTFECELIAKNGRSLLVETSARLMLKDGQVNSLQAISRDIAERKRAEETLRESEAHYRQLVEMSPNSIFIESEGKVAFINKAGLSLFGASRPDELLGKPVLDLIHPNHRAIVLERMTRIRDKHEPVPLLEEKYVRLDGRVVDVEAAAAPILFEGKPAAQVIIHDITERKRAEKELFESRQM